MISLMISSAGGLHWILPVGRQTIVMFKRRGGIWCGSKSGNVTFATGELNPITIHIVWTGTNFTSKQLIISSSTYPMPSHRAVNELQLTFVYCCSCRLDCAWSMIVYGLLRDHIQKIHIFHGSPKIIFNIIIDKYQRY